MNHSPWWHGATLYHVYVRSFQDADGDGHGDLRGLISRLDYLRWLGIDGLWLSPTMPSPNHDWGYDVSDYRGVHPDLGTLDDLDDLVSQARERGIRVLLDLVPNHTSSEHPWFVEARSGTDSHYRDYYVWAPPKSDGSAPNNWLDDTGEPAWTWDEKSGEYYLHNFLPEQPDLNWWNPAVHAEFDAVMDFWFDRGIAGFRIDVANGLYKDARLRDNPKHDGAYIYGREVQGRYGLQHLYNFNQPEVHEVYRHWRRRAESRPEAPLLLGETWVARVDELAPYYGDGDQLQLGFNFPFIFAPFEAPALARMTAESLAAFPTGACPIWAGSNHDLPRMATRWAQGDERRTRLAHTVLAMLPGTYALYYGDELGMTDSDIPAHLHRDPLTAGERNGQWPRDNARAPMRWDRTPGAGFTTGEPWLPLPDDESVNVADQRASATSTLALVRALIGLRDEHFAGEVARYREVEVSETRWVFTSGPLTVVAGFSAEPQQVDVPGVPVLSSATVREDLPAAGSRPLLRPWEALVLCSA
ncbi:alpha-amylase family glycosyl hydrolase [Actinomadura luteofluorescens]|uniref:alpha-amylase family glycosyl hydrolase n=1 Tax=Actinomadura luteofluorescens TaxID=46163 RepID=UPI0021647AE9|nr:alpha-amylase family glycosyl hydrolase [Actinomadura glauciflava]MCR3743544.1 alpha-glucosidase [Actinomadura glauciflava]